MDQITAILTSPALVTLIISLLAYAAARLFARPAWQQYEGLMISAVKMAEKMIPDNVEHRAMRRADEALKEFIAAYTRIYQADPPATLLREVQLNLPVVHDALEAEGAL